LRALEIDVVFDFAEAKNIPPQTQASAELQPAAPAHPTPRVPASTPQPHLPKKPTFFDVEVPPTPLPASVPASPHLNPAPPSPVPKDSVMRDILHLARSFGAKRRRGDSDLFELDGGLFGAPNKVLHAPPLRPLPADLQAQIAVPPLVSTSLAAGELAVPKLRTPTAGVQRRTLARRLGIVATLAGVGGAAFALRGELKAKDSPQPPTAALSHSATVAPTNEARLLPATVAPALTTAAVALVTAHDNRAAPPPRDPVPRPHAAPSSPKAPSAPLGAPVVAPVAATQPSDPGAEFNRAVARIAVATAAGRAASCRGPDDPEGTAKVSLTFSPSGRVTAARVVAGPFQGTRTGGCIASAFRGISVPEFSGDPVTVTKEVVLR
jgi:hypothetical protein